jgi:hypothetical protein
VRSLDCAAVIALGHCRGLQLPNSRTSLVTSCLGSFSLRYSHFGTSLLIRASQLALINAIAGSLIQITAAGRAKTLAVLFAEDLSRQLEKNIGNCNIIEFNALSVSNDVVIVITAERRNYNMCEIVVIFAGKFLETPVADKVEGEVSAVIQINDPSPVVESAVYIHR